MKFLNLQLRAFGHFSNRTLDFSGNDRNFHVVHGPNEAGKSTSLRAIKGLLFEIPSRSPDDFLHKASQLRVAAELRAQDGRQRLFVRRKGNKDTLLDEHDQPLPEAELAQYLGHLGSATFESVFCLDHHVLRQGGEDLLAGKGALAESLFQAGTGLTGLRAALARLEAQAEEIFKPRGSNSKLNQSLAAYEKARSRSRESALSPKDWAERSEQFKRMQDELETLRAALSGHRTQLNGLGRCQVALKHFALYQQQLTECDALKQVVLLPPNAPQEHAEVRGLINQAQAQGDQARRRIEELQKQLQQLTVPEDLLAQAATIGALVQRVDGYRNALRDLPAVRAQQVQHAGQALHLLAELKPGLPLDQAETLRLSSTLRDRIERLAREHPALLERLEQKKTVRDKAAKKAQATQSDLAECPPPPALDGLEQALENCRAQGDLEAQLEKEEQALATVDREVNLLLSRLGLWQGTLAELVAMPLPLPESVDRFDRELQAILKEQEKLKEQAAALREKLATAERETQTLRLAGAVPMESDLAAARARRQHGWQLVRRAWLEQSADPAAETAFDTQRKLPEAYEQSVAEADDIADRLRREADRCAHLAKLQAGQGEDRIALQQVLEQQQALSLRMAYWQSRWRSQWPAFTPLTPVEMRAWLGRHTTLLQKAEALTQAQERVSRIKQTLTVHLDALRAELSKLEQPPALPAGSLNALLKAAQKLFRQLAESVIARKDLEKSLNRLQQDIAHAQEDVQLAGQALNTWRTSWSETLQRAQLSPDTMPDDALGLLGKLDRLFDSLKEQAGLNARIGLMREYQENFERDLNALAAALAPALTKLPPEAAAQQLQASLARAEGDDVKRKELRSQLTQETQALAAAEMSLSLTQARWKTLLERARCATAAELELAEQQSRQKREKEQHLALNRQALENQAGGAPLEKFLQELAALNPDEVPARIAGLEQTVRLDEARQTELIQASALAEQKLKESNGSIEAAQAAQEAQESLAQVREFSLQYARLRLAAEILRQQMEQHREKNQDPIIRRASQLFPLLTLNSFSRIKVGFDDRDQPILLGVRPNGQEVAVTGMSDGARDQLFLALRLGSLERQLQSAEPVPLILDDLLINFDDDRARATLKVLHEISRATQVLFFTHHTRLRDLARETIGNDQLCVHEL